MHSSDVGSVKFCGTLTVGASLTKSHYEEFVVKADRPVNLDLTSIRFPIPAIVSILHRISGVALFLFIPLLLWLLEESLSSSARFIDIQHVLADQAGLRLLVWMSISAMLYHLVAGIRHLLMDIGIGEGLCCARLSAKAVIGVSAVLIIWIGVALW